MDCCRTHAAFIGETFADPGLMAEREAQGTARIMAVLRGEEGTA